MVSVRLGSGAQEASSVLKFRLAKASARAGGQAGGQTGKEDVALAMASDGVRLRSIWPDPCLRG